MADLYIIDTRDKFRNYRKDTTVPFDKFYVVPKDQLEDVGELAPFSIILPLTDGYAPCLKKQGLDVKELMKKGYKVILPIHMARYESGKKISNNEVAPTYISKASWWRHPSALAEFIPENVTLVTPEGKISPMCMSCENSLQHLAGECTVGTKDCLTHLRVRHKQMDEAAFDKEEKRDLGDLHKYTPEST